METVELFAVEIYGDGSFYPGEVIYGDVYLKTNEELTLREIRIEFYGEAKAFWTEAAGSRRRKRLGVKDYTNYEQYLNIAATVYGKGKQLLYSLSILGIKMHKHWSQQLDSRRRRWLLGMTMVKMS